ncbi:cytochrome P450 [Phanerochaete sordida]|uniref:Cytochrome P450 n=1 Tax=Phanerochaete sordida TaxID=48140 RepID=A0A9P3FXV1_9APHY|nr:cytochrome P450 [Phanerochaete sordida]
MTSYGICTVLILLCWAFWRLLKQYFIRSSLDNIPGPKRASILTGNVAQLFSRDAWNFHDDITEKYPSVVKFHAPFGGKGLYVVDPKALYHVTVKDIAAYEEPAWFVQVSALTFGQGVFATSGEQHRKQRRVLNPVFSIKHMRSLTPIFYAVAHRLRAGLSAELGDANFGETEILGWLGRTALELVGQGGLGHSFDKLDRPVPNPFHQVLQEIMPTVFSLHLWRVLLPYVMPYIPPRVRRLVGPWLPHRAMQKWRSIVRILDEQAREIYDAKKDALEKGDEHVEHEIHEGRDILSVLLKANSNAAEGDRLSEEEVIGQISSLVFAATDTTSSATARILQLLAEHPDVQDKVRAELLEASPDGEDIPYDRLVDLPFLDAVCRESLRLYSPVIFMSRDARQDAVLPLSEPIQGVNGALMTEIIVPKGTSIVIGILACNKSKALWGDDALEWKPERWLSPLPESLTNAHIPGIYSHLMTFLGGGRACIGFKFSQLEMKVLLAALLPAFRFTLGQREIYWNVAGVSYPTVGRENSNPEMYLNLEVITP